MESAVIGVNGKEAVAINEDCKWNPVLKKLIGELSLADSEKESNLKSILRRLIGRFCEHHNKWRELTSASRNSLVALDELGRGTSTSDGQAIAESVLEHFVHKVQCQGMFSTHYHRLSIDYQKDSRISLCHMACQIGKGSRGLEEVTFLYRLTPGACPKSYGVNVARLAGLPDDVLQRAVAKSEELEIYGHNKQSDENLTGTLLRSLINLVKHNKCDDNKGVVLGELNGLQNRARILLEQN
ncbi:hypothetical protein K7X08_010217 [Anisodus acutangulus]|uniref:DNA mismatch repair proteins mutS family domain-containing protein n=1 Tax=Anisodus acutangulus TaxID=402998 RepID=A0A9Q1N569_9SOLA|nr:hypothetical protein K7X08_010217 [Anisodus acutangulus]